MKFGWLMASIAALVAAGMQSAPKPFEYVLFLSGNAGGYLSPCGCSAPMIGGTRRRANAIEQLGIKGRTLLLENGGLVKSAGRQDEIKLETFAQLHAAAHGVGLNLTATEAGLGPGAVLSMVRLSGSKLLSANLPESNQLGVQPYRVSGPFAILGVSTNHQSVGGALGSPANESREAIRRLSAKPTLAGKAILLILDGNREEAIALARQVPTLSMIQYQSRGRPPAKSERVGNVILASPGDGGRFLVRLTWRTDRFTSYNAVELGPIFADDKAASPIYRTYLSRISEEQLLEQLPRTETARFSGNKACGSCHDEAMDVWKSSKHASALHTLEREGHQRDPDCVECHVVGLASIYGFQSRAKTPNLADVGCESCHGPGANHSANPKTVKMGAAGSKACMPCHQIENSPKFDFATYWSRIKHK